MAITLIQSNTAVTAAAGPTTITPALAGNATPGNFLIVLVLNTNTTPSIASPPGWTVIRNSTNNALNVGFFYLANCGAILGPGPVALGGTAGGAVASIFEFSGMGPTPAQERNNTRFFATTNAPNTNESVPVPATNELLFAMLCFTPATINNLTGSTSEFSTAVGVAVSTNGVPNAQIAAIWGTSQGVQGEIPNLNVALSASVPVTTVLQRFFATGSSIMTTEVIGGSAGLLSGTFYQGMVGG